MAGSEVDEHGGDYLLKFEDVHKDYGEAGWALHGMNLEVHAGEFLTLLGPSGGGKSTALMMLAGFDTSTMLKPPELPPMYAVVPRIVNPPRACAGAVPRMVRLVGSVRSSATNPFPGSWLDT